MIEGTESELAGKADACAGCANQEICASNEPKGADPALPLIRERMSTVKRKILVLSGKGGVGKSTFTAQLGWAFAADEQLMVCFLIYFAKKNSVASAHEHSRIDGDYGYRHLWSVNTHHPRHRFRTSAQFLVWLVASVRTRQLCGHVCRVYALLVQGRDNVAWS